MYSLSLPLKNLYEIINIFLCMKSIVYIMTLVFCQFCHGTTLINLGIYYLLLGINNLILFSHILFIFYYNYAYRCP